MSTQRRSCGKKGIRMDDSLIPVSFKSTFSYLKRRKKEEEEGKKKHGGSKKERREKRERKKEDSEREEGGSYGDGVG